MEETPKENATGFGCETEHVGENSDNGNDEQSDDDNEQSDDENGKHCDKNNKNDVIQLKIHIASQKSILQLIC